MAYLIYCSLFSDVLLIVGGYDGSHISSAELVDLTFGENPLPQDCNVPRRSYALHHYFTCEQTIIEMACNERHISLSVFANYTRDVQVKLRRVIP